MSGFLGGSTSSTVEVPKYIEDAAKRNLARADTISQIGFTPYYGPDVAAFTPMQEAAFRNTAGAAGAFGLAGAPIDTYSTTGSQMGDIGRSTAGAAFPIGMSQQDIMGGMSAPTTYAGGVRGYSSAPMYEQSIAELAARRPGQKALIDSLFIDPYSGVAGSNVGPLVDYTIAPTPGDLGGISAGGGDVYSPETIIGTPTAPTDGTIYTSTDFAGGEVPYTIVTPTDARPPGYIDNTPSTFTEQRQYYDSSPMLPGGPAVLQYDDGTSVDLGYDLGPSVAGGRGTIVPAQPTYTAQPTQEQLDYAGTSLDPFGGAGPDVTSGPIAGLISGGGADGVGNFGQVGDFFGGIGDALGITDYSGQGGGLLSGLNVTGPVKQKTADQLKYEADRAPGGIFYESGGSQQAEAAKQAEIQAKDDALAQEVDTSELAKLANRKDTAQQWLKDNGYGNYNKDDATDVLRSKVADIEKSQLKQGIKDGVVMENDRYSVYVNGTLISSEKRSSEAKAKLASATG